jgi:ATP-binding cassette subfamily B protein
MNTLKNKWFEHFVFPGAGKWLVITAICLAVSAVLGAFVPSEVAALGRGYGDAKAFAIAFRSLLILFIATYINRVVYQLLVNRYVLHLMEHARNTCYERWIRSKEETGSERFPQGEVIARIMNDTEALRELVTSGTMGILIDVFFVGACLFSFIGLNPVAGPFLSIVELLAVALLIWGSKYMRTMFLEVRDSRGRLSRTLANVVGGLKEAYYTNHSGYASKKTSEASEDFVQKQLKANFWDASYYSMAESLYPLFLAMMVFIFPYSKITEAAVIFALVDLIQRSINPVKEVAGKITNVQRALTGVQRIADFTKALEGQSETKGATFSKAAESMSVEGLSFRYPARKTDSIESFSLLDVSFSVKRGELVGVVGLSGSGKSTLMNVLAGGLRPVAGAVALFGQDGQRVASFDQSGDHDSYRQQVGLVSQESHIFSEALSFNISLKRVMPSDFPDFWTWASDQVPYLKSWGLHPASTIDQKALSLGQKQLLAAVRACYLKKPVVIFDEISSGLDSELELALRKMVLIIQSHALTFIVAHRMETVVGADQILVMSKGRLISSGTHADLLNSSPEYASFLAELSHKSVSSTATTS